MNPESISLIQTFELSNPENTPFQILNLRALSNWGHPEYTCLYQIEIHSIIEDALNEQKNLELWQSFKGESNHNLSNAQLDYTPKNLLSHEKKDYLMVDTNKEN